EADNEPEYHDRFGQGHEDQDVREQFGLLGQRARATGTNGGLRTARADSGTDERESGGQGDTGNADTFTNRGRGGDTRFGAVGGEGERRANAHYRQNQRGKRHELAKGGSLYHTISFLKGL